ncbi:MAG TPA: phosphatase PAP2 family protein [Gemmatimonadales bacterium]|jgi:membrane-associated phospholipid phosphatase|nr:phosphatase PAP2 family protein [Gemmatimonadales bacterium]
MRNPIGALVAAALLVPGGPLPAQAARPAALPRSAIPWWAGAIGAGVVAATSLVDEPARDAIQEGRSGATDDLARVVRHFGQPEVYAPAALGPIAVGLIAGRPAVRRAGERIAASLLVAGAVTSTLKLATGRSRPNVARDAWDLHPFTGGRSFPSGHTAVAFALAASVSDEIRSPPATVGLYGAAALTAWSRLNDNKHWLSDVVAATAIGIASAKLVNGRWKVFGISGPRFLVGPGGARMTWRF